MNEQTIFYKATRPDGFDFYSRSIDYAAAIGGESIAPYLITNNDFPGSGWLHLATVPTECVGASWPLRLFEVEPVGEVHRQARHPHKVGCKAVRVLREIDAHDALGPQGRAVAALIERARRLTGDEIDRLSAAWAAAWDAAWDAAWAAAWAAARDAARAAARAAACDATWAAARALVVRDLITDERYEALVGPWRDVIGDPMEGYNE